MDKARHSRSLTGLSLIEMLFTVFLTSLVAAAIAEIAVTQNVVAFRTFNKLDSLLNARKVASYIEHDIHVARFIGDQFATANVAGVFVPPNAPNYFPAGGAADPYNQSGPTDPSIINFQGWANGWAAPPYSLDPQTLILQVPVFSSVTETNKVGVPTNSIYSPGFWNVDTYVYKIIADVSKPGTGQFVLQRAVFPGEHPNANYVNPPSISSSTPQTILTGIIGPIDPNGAVDSTAGTPLPKVFSFFCRQQPLYKANNTNVSQSLIQVPSPQPSDASNLIGIAFEVELYSDSASKRADLVPRSVGLRTEMYVKGNYRSVQ